ncbi:hypothetical protein RchiOBHm_Chr2g0159311 [Rosa chinensis]|uniref:Uncharacterized protein n=1 Tax=Rosa chinensis TaxID=74649 RepID=A0A2P6S282_ROSCH|nr:uncharacterized protein LOC112185006 [Rosa chinensis]PRQ52789.1 hypothetical protein RchiOBHm_Chr2g0159311 [Rosa chinensis]
MGNCMMRSNSKVSAQDHDRHEPAEKEVEAIQPTGTPMSWKKEKKTVRFNLPEDEDDGGRGIKNGTHDESKSGAVRIRLVVTQEELKQLLNYKNDSISNRSSVEQLLSSLKSRSGRRVSADQIGKHTTTDESWRPVLESISEDQC